MVEIVMVVMVVVMVLVKVIFDMMVVVSNIQVNF